MKMDQKPTATLLELAAKSLLSNEPAAIHALNEIPRDLFVPLFNAAFLGGHKQMLKAMVRVWPFCCLHIGSLNARESYYEIVEAMIDGLQILPAQNSSSWQPKLRILDLRYDLDCETTCSEIRTTFPFCFQSCIYSQHSILKIEEAQNNVRVLPPRMDTLYLSFCGLSNRDVIVLSQSSQATHLRVLNLSNNQIFSEVDEPFLTLLEKVSGTLEHLEVNNCFITDSTLSAILPALSLCSKLYFLSFAFNPITMPALKSLLQHLAPLRRLKHVIYPVPVHCYNEWNFLETLDRRKLAEAQAQVNMMLKEVQREDMKWASCCD
uniref:Leucine-rich repeat-containing protein 14 n=1 Tax=Camelus bactrianus TaxID=9837 RepID=A0A9W3FMA7_CAMBA|nr:melanoma antigen preferentially expressed in tumors-like [Camelus bactrianus]